MADTILSLTYTFSIGIVPGNTYSFKVLSVNSVGQGQLSPLVSRIAATVPNPPTNLQIISQSTTSISFFWSEASNNGGSIVTDFQVWWNAGSGSILSIKVASNGKTPTTATITGSDIQPDKDYQVAISSLNSVGYSALSSTLTIISANVPSAPG